MAVQSTLKQARRIDSGPLKSKGYIDSGPLPLLGSGGGSKNQSVQDILKTFRKRSSRKKATDYYRSKKKGSGIPGATLR